jgi:hypothetical protein
MLPLRNTSAAAATCTSALDRHVAGSTPGVNAAAPWQQQGVNDSRQAVTPLPGMCKRDMAGWYDVSVFGLYDA